MSAKVHGRLNTEDKLRNEINLRWRSPEWTDIFTFQRGNSTHPPPLQQMFMTALGNKYFSSGDS